MQRDGDAVAHDRDIADDFFDPADGVGRRCRLRLRVLSGSRRTGEQIDQVAGDSCTVRRHQVRVVLGGKIAGDDVMVAVVAGQDEVRTLAFEMAGKQQFRIGNADSVRMRCVGVNYGRTGAVTALRRRRVSH